jgi:stress response protein YsnF
MPDINTVQNWQGRTMVDRDRHDLPAGEHDRDGVHDDVQDRAVGGPAIAEEEHVVTLREEEVVVDKRAVPKERVRLGTETVTEGRQVSKEVRKEQLQVDGDQDQLPRRGQR